MRAIEDLPFDDVVKGSPGGAPIRIGDVGRQGWNLLREDLPLPLAVLKSEVLDGNSRWMRDFVNATGALIAPHGKTTMSPQLFRRQLDDGAWAITVATVAQLLVCRRFGISRIVLANQLVGRQAIRTVVAELARDPAFELYALVDSVEGALALAAEAERVRLARPVPLLVEGGFAGGRTGCRTHDDAMTVARAVASSPHLALVGVEGFEGLFHSDDHAQDEASVGAFLDFLVAIAVACAHEGLFAPGPVLLSAGGSAYYDMVADRLARSGVARARVLLRSGCYLTHDDGVYRDAFAHVRARSSVAAKIVGALRPALEILAYVQSRPEPTRAILGVGKRDVGNDMGLPIARAWCRPGTSAPGGTSAPLEGHDVVALNDQHAHLRIPSDSPLRVGDIVMLGVSHPCTTFDKWQVLLLVNDAYDVVGAVRTFF